MPESFPLMLGMDYNLRRNPTVANKQQITIRNRCTHQNRPILCLLIRSTNFKVSFYIITDAATRTIQPIITNLIETCPTHELLKHANSITTIMEGLFLLRSWYPEMILPALLLQSLWVVPRHPPNPLLLLIHPSSSRPRVQA